MHLKSNSLSCHFRVKLSKTMNSRLVLFFKKNSKRRSFGLN